MIDHEAPLAFSFGAILRVGIPVSILWIIGDAIDGGSQSFIGVPLLIAAWLGAFVALDRWVSGQAIKTSRPAVGAKQKGRAAGSMSASPANSRDTVLSQKSSISLAEHGRHWRRLTIQILRQVSTIPPRT
jgi:hypothetical protein